VQQVGIQKDRGKDDVSFVSKGLVFKERVGIWFLRPDGFPQVRVVNLFSAEKCLQPCRATHVELHRHPLMTLVASTAEWI
jgi:hypothetical protein